MSVRNKVREKLINDNPYSVMAIKIRIIDDDI
jgi:hypothetical protein